MDRFNDYINDVVAPEKGLEEDWVYNTLTVGFVGTITVTSCELHGVSNHILFLNLFSILLTVKIAWKLSIPLLSSLSVFLFLSIIPKIKV